MLKVRTAHIPRNLLPAAFFLYKQAQFYPKTLSFRLGLYASEHCLEYPNPIHSNVTQTGIAWAVISIDSSLIWCETMSVTDCFSIAFHLQEHNTSVLLSFPFPHHRHKYKTMRLAQHNNMPPAIKSMLTQCFSERNRLNWLVTLIYAVHWKCNKPYKASIN